MKSVRSIILVTAFLLATYYAKGQNHATTIKVQAMEMANGLMKNDFNLFIKYMHPAIIEFAGGRDKMQSKMDSAYQAMKRFNIRFKRYWIGHPAEIVKYNDQLQTLLPQTTVIITPLGEVFAETAMIVISNDNGKHWWFIDTNLYDAEKLKNILPGLSPELVVPERKKARLVRSGS